jgi:hypothetical protein
MNWETIKEIFAWGSISLLGSMTLVQISPIKIDPWSLIGRWLGRMLNGEVLEKVDALDDSIKHNKADDDERWASLSRSHILRFGDELRHGISHSKEHFDQILLDISKYEQYCESHPEYLNNVANETIKHIKKAYQHCLDENNFL